MGAGSVKFRDVPLSSVQATDPFYVHACSREIEYLMSLEPERLLAGFYETRGLAAQAQRYPVWESSEIQGHTIGYYLSALSQAYEDLEDPAVGAVIEYVVERAGEVSV
jgi:DUF1680 family protein